MTQKTIQNKCRGALVGGAVGDALGYEVEFISLATIRKRFGDKGITRYVTHGDIAEFSDDTQMTLFTAEGLMNGVVNTQTGRTKEILPYISSAYMAWYKTQTETPSPLTDSWLSNIKTLWSRRAPGNTCISALHSLSHGHKVRNNSKGCGGVMRVAPIGIFNAAHSNLYDLDDTANLAAWSAEITHQHIASSLASALLAKTVQGCIRAERMGKTEFGNLIYESVLPFDTLFPDHTKEYKEFKTLMVQSLGLAESDIPDQEAIRHLGEGWVGDEALAVAVFSVMRHIDSFEDCIVCAVNHDGDSDSTGAIAGNIIGAIHGYSAIPAHYLDQLEIEPVLVSVADDLCEGLTDIACNNRLKARYINHLPAAVDQHLLVMKKRFTPDQIATLAPGEIFVFGSNLAGHHGGGAARAAYQKFGAIYGQGVGLQGQSYAIPTMQGGVKTIKPYVDDFIAFAKAHPELTFYVTRIGCGIAGFRDEQIAPLFEAAIELDNIILPESFVAIIGGY